jgi:predicted site-specific integrase-resolvase
MTVYRYIAEGRLRPVDVRREGRKAPRYRITAEELQRFQTENRRTVVLYDKEARS